MTRRDMTDEQVRAELERIDEYYAHDWDEHEKCKAEMPHDCPTRSALRLLAELHAGMGEIEKCAAISYKGYTEMFPIFPDSTSEDDTKRMTILGSFQEII